MKIHIILFTLLISVTVFAGDQFRVLSMQERAEVIVERDPQKIGVNFSDHWGLADGGSATGLREFILIDAQRGGSL